MNINYTDLMKRISDVIVNSVEQLLKTASYDQSHKVCITEVVSSKKVKIELNGKTYTATTGTPYGVGTYVWVCVPRNNWNNLYVVCKA